MSGVAAPAAAGGAAPAAPSGNGVSNGTPAPASSTATQAPAAPGVNGTATPRPGETTAAASSAAVEKLLKKLRVGGKELEVDFASEDTAREYQTLKHNAYKVERYQQEMRDFQRTKERLAAGDPSVFQELGVDIGDAVQRAVQAQQQMAEMSPEQQAFAQREAQLAAREKALEQQETQRRQMAEQARKQAVKKQTFNELMQAAKAAGLPLDSKAERGAALALAARIHAAEIKAGRPRMSPEQLGALMEKVTFGELSHKVKAVASNPAIRARRAAELKALHDAAVSSLEGDALLDFYGPEHVKRIYAAGMARLNARNPVTGTPVPQRGATTSTGGGQLDYAALRAKYNIGG